MHGFENETNLTGHLLEQMTDLVEGQLVVTEQPLGLLFGHAAAKCLFRVDRPPGKHQRQITEVFTHLQLIGELFDRFIVETSHCQPQAAKVFAELVRQRAVESVVEQNNLRFSFVIRILSNE